MINPISVMPGMWLVQRRGEKVSARRWVNIPSKKLYPQGLRGCNLILWLPPIKRQSRFGKNAVLLLLGPCREHSTIKKRAWSIFM